MKISDLIYELESIKKAQGDLEVSTSFNVPHEAGDCGDFNIKTKDISHFGFEKTKRGKTKEKVTKIRTVVLDSKSFPYF